MCAIFVITNDDINELDKVTLEELEVLALQEDEIKED